MKEREGEIERSAFMAVCLLGARLLKDTVVSGRKQQASDNHLAALMRALKQAVKSCSLRAVRSNCFMAVPRRAAPRASYFKWQLGDINSWWSESGAGSPLGRW